jgi:hypothetical protein
MEKQYKDMRYDEKREYLKRQKANEELLKFFITFFVFLFFMSFFVN